MGGVGAAYLDFLVLGGLSVEEIRVPGHPCDVVHPCGRSTAFRGFKRELSSRNGDALKAEACSRFGAFSVPSNQIGF